VGGTSKYHFGKNKKGRRGNGVGKNGGLEGG